MAWADFKTCMGDAAERLEEVGERAIRGLFELWRALPLDVRAFVIAAGRYGATYIAAALAAAGVEAADAIAAIAVGFGVGYFFAALVDCGSQHLA